MIYRFDLECPNCGWFNEIITEEPNVEWVCEICKTEPVTSLPTDGEGNLL
jgi:hypothetical protein